MANLIPVKVEQGMKDCQQCNLDFPDDFRFCLSCGSTLREPSLQSNLTDRETYVRCPSCKNFVRTDVKVCEHCGTSLVGVAMASTPAHPEPPQTRRFEPQEWHVAPEQHQRTTGDSAAGFQREAPTTRLPGPTSATRSEKTAPSFPGVQSYGTPDSPSSLSFKWWHGAILLLFVLLFAGGLGVAGWWWLSSRDSVTQSRTRTNPTPSTSTSTTSGSKTTTDKDSPSPSADDELKELRGRRSSARRAEGNKIVTDLEAAEKKYPTDYRFPYERAKLSIKGVISHHEAFEAIFLAAERAIDNGKTEEMLNDLMSDKDGDFYKMSRGHHEWETLEDALRHKDKSALKKHD